MDIWYDVDTALAEVPVNLLPLVDDTDFKTREVAVAYDAAGMDLVWNFVTTGGAATQTAVTPTTGGDYDWAHLGDGIYTIEIPATGGASINNDTEGFGWFTGVATGVLPWRGPVIGFRAAAVNDALIDGGDTLDVNVTAMAAGTVTAAAIDTGAIDADAVAADAVTEIQAGLSTLTLTQIIEADLAGYEATGTGTRLADMLVLMRACLAGRIALSGTTLTVYEADGTTAIATYTVAADGTTRSTPA